MFRKSKKILKEKYSNPKESVKNHTNKLISTKNNVFKHILIDQKENHMDN